MADSPFALTVQRKAIHSILLATDFSAVSGCALEYALAFASSFNSELFVTHILRSRAERDDLGAHEVDPHRRYAENCVRSLENSGMLKGITHSVVIERGHVCEALARVVEKKKIDLVILGIHGPGGILKLILGCKADEVLRLAPCPVMTVASHGSPPALPVTFRNILAATDRSAGSLQCLSYALSIAEAFHAKLTLLHAVESTAIGWPGQLSEIQDQERRKLEALVPDDSRCLAEIRLQGDWPADEIVHVSQEEKVDLIVMAAGLAHPTKAFPHLPWTVAHQVICRAPCPVFTVPDHLTHPAN